MRSTLVIASALLFGLAAVGQSVEQTAPPSTQARAPKRGPGRQIGSGAGDIGVGAAKGAGNLAKGTAVGAADLVTLHPIDAATSLGKGGVYAGKDVAVGTVKGTGKIVAGVARGLKRLF